MKRIAPMIMVLATMACLCAMADGDVVVDVPMPTFSLDSASGERFDSKDELRDAVSVVTFWRLGQSRSADILKDLQELHNELAESGLKVVGICTGDSGKDAVAALAKELGLTFPLLLDPDRAVYAAFGVFVSPATCLADKEGILRFYKPSHTKAFLDSARIDVSLLLGKLSKEEHAQQVAAKGTHTDRGSNVKEDSRYGLGVKLLERGDRKGAMDQFRQAWESESKSVSAGLQLGVLLLEDGESDEALEVLEGVRELAPKHARATAAYAVALIRTGDKEQGRELLEGALKLRPNEPYLCFEMGRIYEEEGNHEEALVLYKCGLQAALGH